MVKYTLTLYDNESLQNGKILNKSFTNFTFVKKFLKTELPNDIKNFLIKTFDYTNENIRIEHTNTIICPDKFNRSIYVITAGYMNNLIGKYFIEINKSYIPLRSYTTLSNSMWSLNANPIEAIQEYVDYSNKMTTIYPISVEDWKDAKYSD